MGAVDPTQNKARTRREQAQASLPAGRTHPARGRWSSRLCWFGVAAVVCALAVPMLAYRLHSSMAEVTGMALYMVLSGVVSVILAGVVCWLSGMARPGNMRAQLGTLIFLGALMIALNIALLAHLLFISSHDAQLLLLFATFGVVVALLLALPLAGRITRAVELLELGAGRIATGEHNFRIAEGALSGTKELAHLARLINALADDLQQACAQRQVAEAHREQTLTAVSHDLRTPITCIQAIVEAITDGIVADPASIQRYHQALRAEVRRFSALLDELFELTRLESGALALDRERMFIEDVIGDAVEASQDYAEQVHIHVTYQVDGVLPPVVIDAGKIYRVMSDLLTNALRYTSPGGAILVRVSKQARADQKQDVLVQVIDTGEGIAEHDLAHIFEPTYRGEPSRKRRATEADAERTGCEGGLGLTIAAHLVNAHGGQIWAASPLPIEARALVALPGELPEPPCGTGMRPHAATPGTVVSFTIPAAFGATQLPITLTAASSSQISRGKAQEHARRRNTSQTPR
jgi:signal transduction histidine kinase